MIRRFRRSMAATALDPRQSPLALIRSKDPQNNVVVEEIEGLIRVYKDGHVERPQMVPCVPPTLPPELGITCRDIAIDKYTNVWARLYVPNSSKSKKLPLLVYFHGGGFCVGSAAWSCYHDFLAKLASQSNVVILSVNYRLAPENPLPAAYDDGVKALIWLRQQESVSSSEWWANKCNFSRIYLSGDSAGANIAFHVALTRPNRPPDVVLQGLILIQPFFGGEARTNSEKYTAQSPRSALTLAASDAYWRMSLPAGANRDHPWCNPAAGKVVPAAAMRTMVCVAEMDILKDRSGEVCGKLGSQMGVRMEQVIISKGVGHAFQILNKSALSQARTNELISCITNFVH
ncbi:probable carboxylesterase 6 [Andrographis paniculata]|uniref:probable carboxylesterase 6 n=1 Tax=Andrographis paniculata TaxID=175694 RepID=UPI0021E82E6B|nr:probable carboxylesterase 6 [Andrographis paniculata]